MFKIWNLWNNFKKIRKLEGGKVFDEHQDRIVFCDDDKALLVVSPGSVKISVIVKRLLRLIDDGVSRDNILLITFNRKACENMRSRFVQQLDTDDLPRFHTFHSLICYIFKNNISKDVSIIDENLMERFLTQNVKSYTGAYNKYKISSIMSDIDRFRSSGKSIENFESTIPKDLLREIMKSYGRFKIENNLVDFDDLTYEIFKLFKERQDILNFYRSKFKYILVDDFQDCDDVQFKILKMISENSKLFCVGYEDQSIYNFRKNKSDVMSNFCNVFENGKKYYLKYNYRSKYSIVNFSRNVISNNKIRNEKQFVREKKEEGEVICKRFLEDAEQGNYIANDIEYVMKNGGELSDFAVLYRNHSDSFSILSEFIKRNIKINFLDSDFSIFEQFYIKDIINLIFFIDNPSVGNFEKIYNKIIFLFSRRAVDIINNYDYDANVFSVADANIDKLSTGDRKNIHNLKRVVNKIRKYNLSKRVKKVLDKLGYLTYINNVISAKSVDYEDVKYFIRYFYNLTLKFSSIDQINKSIDSINSIHGVNFGTIHASKGMEFKCVYMMNVQSTDENFGMSNINISYDEEKDRRIFYVGITRTIDKLKILSPHFINARFVCDPMKFVNESSKDFEFGKFGFVNTDNMKKASKNKVLLYDSGRKKHVNIKGYLNIT